MVLNLVEMELGRSAQEEKVGRGEELTEQLKGKSGS
jgi:hypothetical protein